MDALQAWEYVAVGLIFVWGGFVRSGLGFGGAALTLPMLLLIVDSPVIVLPLIAVHMLLLGSVTLLRRMDRVDWPYLGRALVLILPFKVVGVMGLLSLPAVVLTTIVYATTAIYALSYILNRPFRSRGRLGDGLLLAFGGYVSGTSLTSAPLIIAVFARHVAANRLRETLFALWVLLVAIKLAAFVATGTDLQLRHHLWLFPCALLGHLLGLRLHRTLQSLHPERFLRAIGWALLAVTLVGAWSALAAA